MLDGRLPNVKRDCAVRALTVAAGIDYTVAYIAMTAAGRRQNCGTYFTTTLKVFAAFNVSLKPATYHEYVTGQNVVVTVPGHIFAIKNGVHSDGVCAHVYRPHEIKGVWVIES